MDQLTIILKSDPRREQRGSLKGLNVPDPSRLTSRVMKEQRRLPRTNIDHPGKLLFDADTVIECSVRNVTGLGMCILLKQAFDNLPTTVDFSFDGFKTLRRCDVSWHHGHLVGVVFLDGAQHAVSRSTPAKMRKRAGSRRAI